MDHHKQPYYLAKGSLKTVSSKFEKMAIVILLALLMLAQVSSSSNHKPPLLDTKSPEQHQVSSNMIAFSAEIGTSKTISEETTIAYENVITNVGGLYVNNSGQFICPDSAIYVFIWNIRKTSDSPEGMRCFTKLRSGGIDQKYGPKTSYYSTTWSGNTEMMAVLQCTTNPPTAVTVMTVPAAAYHSRSSFTGFRLVLPIAFTVELSKDHYIMDGGRIMFDRILSNFGGHYDRVNGFFRCPDNGIYMFSISAHTTDPNTPWSVTRLMKEEEVVIHGPITYIATSQFDSGSSSTSAVIQCTTEHSIYVETQAAHTFPHNSYAQELTAFTGFKLYDNTEDAIAFTAVMTQNRTTTTAGQPFIFDKVILNLGDAFNPITGAFVCPDDDYYDLSWTVTADHGGTSSSVDLYMDETFIKELYLTRQVPDNDDLGTSGTVTNSLIKQCVLGSEFQVRGRGPYERVYLADYTLFSGYKIPANLI